MKYLVIRKDPPQVGYELWIDSGFIGWAYLHDALRWLQREIENEIDPDMQIPAPVHRSEWIQGVD